MNMPLIPLKHESKYNSKDLWLVNQFDGTWKEQALTREQMRALAKKVGVQVGRNTDDSANNLIEAKIIILRYKDYFYHSQTIYKK